MIYYSHSRDGRLTKKLLVHTQGVADRAETRRYAGVDFGFDWPVAAREWLAICVGLHDFGKLTRYFQRYLKGETVDQYLKSHALLGAVQVWHQLSTQHEEAAYLCAYLIAHHHQSLSQPGKTDSPLYIKTIDRIDDLVTQYEALPNPTVATQHIGTTVTPYPYLGSKLFRELKNQGKKYRKRNREGRRGIETFLGTNYYFSLLIEADKLDASDTPLIGPRALPPAAVEQYIDGFGGADKPLNQLRTAARHSVLSVLERSDLLTQKLFTLTAPTGLGKTLTALDFASRLAERLTAVRGTPPQLIVALPFISIIEQTLAEYHGVLQQAVSVVGHYQFADVLADRDLDLDKREEGVKLDDYERARMQLDTWQADVVITSFVQLFGSIITGRNAALKKFNHLAGSILILDEIQSVRADLLPFIGVLLHYLTRCLDVRVIVMTATKPLLFEQADKLLEKIGVPHRPAPLELLTDYADYFARFDRTRMVIAPVGETIDSPGAFVAYFDARWTDRDCALIVVNLVNRSLELHAELAQVYGDRIRLYYLSTNVLPVDRERRIEEVRRAMQDFRSGVSELPVILVSTQVVEAGVDLDFDLGFRDRAPVPSLVQVAGRLNRNQRAGRERAPLYVFAYQEAGKDADALRIYGTVTVEAVTRALGERSEIPEPGYLELCDRYFRDTDNGVYMRSRKCFEACELMRYDELEAYALIGRDEHVRPVYIALPGVGTEALAAFEQLRAGQYADRQAYYAAKSRFDQQFGTTFRKHVLNVPKRYAEDVDELTDYLWVVRPDDVSARYTPTTGWRRDTVDSTNSIMLL